MLQLKPQALGFLNNQIRPIFRKAAHGFVTARLTADHLFLSFVAAENGEELYTAEIAPHSGRNAA
jgi:hypothetical protein